MLITLTIILIMSNAATMKKDKSILYSRIAIQGLIIITYVAYSGLYIKSFDKGIGIFNSLFNITTLSQSFNIFIMLLGGTICILNAFYPRTIESILVNLVGNNSSSENESLNSTDKEFLLNKNSSQYTIIEYALIMIFILCGAVFLMSTGDLISLFLSIELQSYGLYILATLYRNSESATGSGLTYFLLGGLSSCFILLGSAILYVNSGTTDLDNLYIINTINEFTGFILESIESNNLNISSWGELYGSNYINFSLIVLSVGFLFKVSAAPFHFWSPDVYDGIPTIVTTFVAIIAKISIFVILLELVSYMETTQVLSIETSQSLSWKNIIVLSSLMSLFIGSVLGLTQYRIKRLFAYSTISHVGFILLALSINSMESIQGYIFYILQYSISNLNGFFILISIGYTLYLYQYMSNISGENNTSYISEDESKFIDINNSPVQLLSQIKGYFHINSFLAISLAITLFSFVGIPPLIGFFAKQMVLSAALDQGYIFMTLVGVITSVIGAVYYLNIIKLLFFSESDYSKVNGLANINLLIKSSNVSIYINSALSITVTVLTMVTLLFMFSPDEWFRFVSILSHSLSDY